ncbi:uncharacterized protein LOC135695968 isoform X2 [Rhopilema esculentum]|uniref:uncharacterized protein LOC135695968 isoform X2 n=1 Tax=Rhopilema esculentum TaxID=499914 RepID=UPI0031DB0B3B
MHIYLKNGDQQRWLIVELIDGHMPRLSGFSLSHSQVAETLEPAIWFKLMVIDSISIDCQKYVVSWNTISTDASSETRYLMFEDEDQSCYDFNDDIDELYHLATFLITTNPMAVLNDKDRQIIIEDYERSVFRMLHCYILGKITLRPEDIVQVENALEAQNQAILFLDDLMLMHKRTEVQLMGDMRELRESRILPFFNKLLTNESCNNGLVSLLKENVIKDLQRVRNEFDVAQRRVDRVKLEMNQGATSSEYSSALAKARGKRDVIAAKMCQLLEWREMLDAQSNIIGNFVLRGPVEPVILRYFELHEKVKEEKHLGKLVCDKKVRASSVRASIESTLRDLKAGIESAGVEVSISGQKPTDVNENGPTAEWQTLTERLASILYNKDHPVGMLFLNTTTEISRRCKEVFSTYEHLSNTSSDTEGFVDMNKGNVNFSEDLEYIKLTIQEHFEKSLGLLMECFDRRNPMFWQKLRLGYEKFLYQEVGSCLLQLYRVVNGNVMISLAERVTRLRDFPVCSLGLQMKQEWWLSLFEPVAANAPNYASCAQNVCSFDSDDSTDGPAHCYRNIDLMREKLQLGTVKVLSRSFSDNDINAATGSNLVRASANVMVKEISSKVVPRNYYVPLNLLIGTLRKEEDIRINMSSSSDSIFRTAVSRRSRTLSTPSFVSTNSRCSSPDQGYASPSATLTRKDGFQKHFGGVITHIKKVFDVKTPLNKMQLITASLRKINEKVGELRKSNPDPSAGGSDAVTYAVSGDELLPLIVLMLLKLEPSQVGKLFVDICYTSDLMADFLSYGCHSYSLTQFQMAFRVLNQVCEELEIP